MNTKRMTSLLCLCAAIVATSVAVEHPARAADAEPDELKSQIVRWEGAKPNVADWGELRKYFTGKTHATQNVLVGVAVIKPGKTIHKTHRHANEEYLAIVEGSGQWTLDGKQTPAQRGDILYVAPWVYHGVTNTGDKPLIFLVIRYDGKGLPIPPRPDDRPDEID